MKRVIKLSMVALVLTSTVQARSDKPYEVKSITIEYDIKGKDTVGKKRVIIDDFGNRELVESNTVKKYMDKVNKNHYIRYLHRNIIYFVDFNKKTIDRQTGYAGYIFGVNKFKDTIDESLKAMHLKKVGTESVAGVECDVWQLGKHNKTCYYKGLPLKKESNGVVEIATKIELDVELSKSDFKLPDFPLDGQKYTQDEIEKMDAKDIEEENKKIEEDKEAEKIFDKAFEYAGVKKGSSPTPEQMKKVQEYMVKATFPIQKKKILEEAKDIKKLKNCLSKANNIKEANHCNPDEDGYDKWDSKTKKETIDELLMFETKIVPCVEKAQNAKDMSVCFPKDY